VEGGLIGRAAVQRLGAGAGVEGRGPSPAPSACERSTERKACLDDHESHVRKSVARPGRSSVKPVS
jgi:hypothetical protein